MNILRNTFTVRRCYITGSIAFIFVGLLHTTTHLLELSGKPLEQRFLVMGNIDVSGQSVASWNLFQGISLLMGLFSIAIGFGALGGLRAARSGHPPVATAATNVATLLAIMLIGALHLGPLQIWGGVFGITMFMPTIIAAYRTSETAEHL